MNRKLLIGLLVFTAIGITVWLKPKTPAGPDKNDLVIKRANAENTVLLFADPREAESSCACAEVIKTARSASNVPNVYFKEFDLTQNSHEVKKYFVRVNPTVVFLDKDNKEKVRFEGETREIITGLHSAIGSLKNGGN